MVPNYLCCDCPNILGTLFTSPRVIFLHNLLEQLVSFSSNIPSFNRCRSATEMKGKLARRERRERNEVTTSFRHFLSPIGAQVPLVKTWMVTKLFEKWSQKIFLRDAGYLESVGNWNSLWRQYHVFSFWRNLITHELFSCSKILNGFWRCLWLLFLELVNFYLR